MEGSKWLAEEKRSITGRRRYAPPRTRSITLLLSFASRGAILEPMAYERKFKTEHAGAKNRGGYWGRRADAKSMSRKVRRRRERREIREALPDKRS